MKYEMLRRTERVIWQERPHLPGEKRYVHCDMCPAEDCASKERHKTSHRYHAISIPSINHSLACYAAG